MLAAAATDAALGVIAALVGVLLRVTWQLSIRVAVLEREARRRRRCEQEDA